MKKSASDLALAKKESSNMANMDPKNSEEVKQMFQEWKNLKHQMHELKKKASQLPHDERHYLHELKKQYKSQRTSNHHHSHERQKSDELKKSAEVSNTQSKDVHIHYHHHHYYHHLPTEEQMEAIANAQNNTSNSTDEVEKLLQKLGTSSDALVSKSPSPNPHNGTNGHSSVVHQPSPKKATTSILLSQDKDSFSSPPSSLNVPRFSSPQPTTSALDVQLAAAILQSQIDAEKSEEQPATVIKNAAVKNTAMNTSTGTFKIKLSNAESKEGHTRQFSQSSSNLASPSTPTQTQANANSQAFYGNLASHAKGHHHGSEQHSRSLSLPSRSALRASSSKLTASGSPQHYVEPLNNSIAHPLMREEEFRIETLPLPKVSYSVIQPFVTQQPAAVGTIGRIFHGTLDGEPVAVKEIHKKDFQLHEVTELKKISHPNIVQLLAYTETEDNLYIIAEWMKRDSLSKFLEYRQNCERPLHYNEILCIAIDIARGMSYLHRHEVNHCDLKLDNVFLNEDGVAKIADYGLAHVQSDTKTKVLNAFRMFLPETFLLENISDKTDILAFGFILWQLTNASVRNGPKTMPKDHQNHLIKKPAISPNTPIVLENLIHECWHDNPNKRPSFDAILAKLMAPHPLLRSNEKVPVLLSREGVWTPLSLQDQVLHIKSRKEVKIINLDNLEVLHELTASTKCSKSSSITAALCDREQKYLFIAKKTFQIWNLETHTIVAEYDMRFSPKDISPNATRSPSPELLHTADTDDITSMCFSHDNKKIYIGLSIGKIKVFKVNKMEFSQGNLDAGHFENVNTPIYALSATEKKVFVGTTDFIQIVNLKESSLEIAPKHPVRLYPGEVHERTHVTAIATNECFIASGWSNGLIVIYDLPFLQPIHTLDEFTAPINSIGIMDGILLAASSDVMRMFREDETQTKWNLLMKTPGDSFVLNRKHFVVYSEKEGLYFETLL